MNLISEKHLVNSPGKAYKKEKGKKYKLYREIGERIQERRIQLNMTQQELSVKLGFYLRELKCQQCNKHICQNCDIDSKDLIYRIRQWEQSINYPNIDQLHWLSDVLNCDLRYLIGDSDSISNSRANAAELFSVNEEEIELLVNMPQELRRLVFAMAHNDNLLTAIKEYTSNYSASIQEYKSKSHGVSYKSADDPQKQISDISRMKAITYFSDWMDSLHSQWEASFARSQFADAVIRFFRDINANDENYITEPIFHENEPTPIFGDEECSFIEEIEEGDGEWIEGEDLEDRLMRLYDSYVDRTEHERCRSNKELLLRHITRHLNALKLFGIDCVVFSYGFEDFLDIQKRNTIEKEALTELGVEWEEIEYNGRTWISAKRTGDTEENLVEEQN